MKVLKLHKHCIRNRTMIVQDMYISNRGTCKYMTYNNIQKIEQNKLAVIIVRYYNMDRHELF
jgi:putative IMPACT (imprinted ancient) family translation regulator